MLFEEPEWDKSDNALERLTTLVAERQHTAQQEREAIDAGDVKGVQEAAGVSDRTARRRTQTQRQQNGDDLMREAYYLFTKQRLSYRKIAKRLGKAPNTIKAWVQKLLEQNAF